MRDLAAKVLKEIERNVRIYEDMKQSSIVALTHRIIPFFWSSL